MIPEEIEIANIKLKCQRDEFSEDYVCKDSKDIIRVVLSVFNGISFVYTPTKSLEEANLMIYNPSYNLSFIKVLSKAVEYYFKNLKDILLYQIVINAESIVIYYDVRLKLAYGGNNVEVSLNREVLLETDHELNPLDDLETTMRKIVEFLNNGAMKQADEEIENLEKFKEKAKNEIIDLLEKAYVY